MSILEKLITRWSRIPGTQDESYRLLCSHPVCSLSCANLKNGKLSVTSVHGTERHSYELSKNDMTVATILFLKSLTPTELGTFLKILGKRLEE